jgi:hypothetical protein
MARVPYHQSELTSVNGTLPVARVLMPPEWCGLPVFFIYASLPLSNFLRYPTKSPERLGRLENTSRGEPT